MKNFSIYLKSIALPVLVGVLVSLIISGSIDYSLLNKPFLSPPAIVFPIVWTILYILMGYSYGRLKAMALTDDKISLVYYIQLFVNALWSIFFFLLKWRLFSFFWILLLIVLVAIMIVQFYRKDKFAGLLQIPYLLWLIFAAYLNLGVYVLN